MTVERSRIRFLLGGAATAVMLTARTAPAAAPERRSEAPEITVHKDPT